MKKKTSKPAATLGPTEVARLARISTQLASRKLREGRSVEQILREAEDMRSRAALRGLPTVAVNGAAGSGAWTYAQAQAEKEKAAALLKQLELGERKGELVESDAMKKWFLHLLLPLINTLRAIPNELQDLLNDKPLQDLLRQRIEGAISATGDYIEQCSMHAGKPLGDGSLDCEHGYRIEWRIIPPVPTVKKSEAM